MLLLMGRVLLVVVVADVLGVGWLIVLGDGTAASAAPPAAERSLVLLFVVVARRGAGDTPS